MDGVDTPIIPTIAALVRNNPGTISLGQGVVNYGPPAEAVAALPSMMGDGSLHKYLGVSGHPGLVEAIQVKLAQENQVQLSSDAMLMVTAGSNMAFLNSVLAVADPGDEFILPTPYYFNQEMAVTLANCRPVLVPTDANYQLDLAALRAAITPRTRAIITVSPNNPTGAVYPEADLRAVNALCAEHGLTHLHDEAYEYFLHDGAKHFSPASIPGAAAHTISLYSMSKTYGFASWRIGWMVYPAALEAALRKIQDTLIICPPVISQFAALGALTDSAHYLRDKLRDLAAVRLVVGRELAPLITEELAEIPPAHGAFYFLPRLRTTRSAMEIAEELIRDHGVAVIPGSAFGVTGSCTIRVAYGALTTANANEGMGRLVRGLRKILRG